jgi:hypothetical protein
LELFKSFQIGPWLIGKEGQGHRQPNSSVGSGGGGEEVVSEHQELKAHRRVGLGGREGDRRWGSHGGRGGGGEELIGERVPDEEGGQIRVQQLQQEERKLLEELDRSEEGRRDEFNGTRDSPARRWRWRGGSVGGLAARSGLEVSVR